MLWAADSGKPVGIKENAGEKHIKNWGLVRTWCHDLHYGSGV